MKKTIFVIIIIILMFAIGFITGRVIIKIDANNEKGSKYVRENIISNDEKNIESSYIIKKGEISTMGLYQIPGQVYTSSKDDLMLNDMNFDAGSSLYYKIITSMENYNKYYERELDIPKLTDKDFEEDFLIIIANEKKRPQLEKYIQISKITNDNDTMNIIMKQNEDIHFAGQERNVFWALVKKEILKPNINIIIENNK